MSSICDGLCSRFRCSLPLLKSTCHSYMAWYLLGIEENDLQAALSAIVTPHPQQSGTLLASFLTPFQETEFSSSPSLVSHGIQQKMDH